MPPQVRDPPCLPRNVRTGDVTTRWHQILIYRITHRAVAAVAHHPLQMPGGEHTLQRSRGRRPRRRSRSGDGVVLANRKVGPPTAARLSHAAAFQHIYVTTFRGGWGVSVARSHPRSQAEPLLQPLSVGGWASMPAPCWIWSIVCG